MITTASDAWADDQERMEPIQAQRMPPSAGRKMASRMATPLLSLAGRLGGYRLAACRYAGCGVIFSLHRVVEPGRLTFYPGHIIHADWLDTILRAVRRMGWELVSVDEVLRRLTAVGRKGDQPRTRFACFTLDDGYADNLTVALPVFREHAAPLCVFVATSVIERSTFYWWGANEELVLKSDRIDLAQTNPRIPRVLWARDYREKWAAYHTLNSLCHSLGDGFFPVLRDAFERYGINAEVALDRAALTVTQLRDLARDPLVTIGSHTVNHQRLCLLSDERACLELEEGRRLLERWLGVEIRHLAYPFGRADACGPREFTLARRLGFKTAVTTRQGNIFPGHSGYLHCLPRRSVPLNQFRLRTVLCGVESVLRRERAFQTE